MFRIDAEPINLEETESRPGKGTSFRILSDNADDVDMKTPHGQVSIQEWPDGTCVPWGTPKQLEYHTLGEEIFVLSGVLHFDDWYKVSAPGYLNHPPFWVHPTNFRAEGDLHMLMTTSLDPIVQFEDIPADWDGTEFFANGKPTRTKGVSKLQLDELPWRSFKTCDGEDTGLEARHIWDDVDDGWSTWMMRAPAGWSGSSSPRSVAGGDQLFVVDGDLSVTRRGITKTLGKYGYASDTTVMTDGDLSSNGGATFIRWIRNAEALYQID